MDDESIKDDELEAGIPDADDIIDEDNPKKPKSLLDDENVESLDDAADDELADDEEPYDDTYDS